MINLKDFMPLEEIEALKIVIRNSPNPKSHLRTIERIKKQIASCPRMRETENQDNPIAVLHYFGGSYDAYITERGENGEAFGWASFGYGFECGYINILELIKYGISLDLYHTPEPIKNLIKEARKCM